VKNKKYVTAKAPYVKHTQVKRRERNVNYEDILIRERKEDKESRTFECR